MDAGTPNGPLASGLLAGRGLAARALALLGLVALSGVVSVSAEILVFGPEKFVRQTGQPVTVTKTFRVDQPLKRFLLRVTNHGVTSAIVAVNGQLVLQPGDFEGKDKDGSLLERSVTLGVLTPRSVSV
jgi:hypothetical protein